MAASDVAEMLQLAEGTVKSQSARGIAALRTALPRAVPHQEG